MPRASLGADGRLPGRRICHDGFVTLRGQRLQRCAHCPRRARTVEPDDSYIIHRQLLEECCNRCAVCHTPLQTRQHGRNRYRDLCIQPTAPLHGDRRIARIHHRLHEYKIHAAVQQPADNRLVDIAQLLLRNVIGQRYVTCRRPDRTGNKTAPRSGRITLHTGACDLRRATAISYDRSESP